jgi:hypothetical protein
MSYTIHTMNYNYVFHAICLLALMTFKYCELQMSFVIKKLNCKANCKTPFFYNDDVVELGIWMFLWVVNWKVYSPLLYPMTVLNLFMPQIHGSEYWLNGNVQSWFLWCLGEWWIILHFCGGAKSLETKTCPWYDNGWQMPIFPHRWMFSHKKTCLYIWEIGMLNLLGLSFCNFINLMYKMATIMGCYSHVSAYSNIYHENFWNIVQAKYWLDMVVTDYYMHGIYGLKCELYSCFIYLKLIQSMSILSTFYQSSMWLL